VTSIGYSQKEIEIKNPGAGISVQMNTQSLIANEIVITASRKAEKLLQSPVSIEKLDIRALKETPALMDELTAAATARVMPKGRNFH